MNSDERLIRDAYDAYNRKDADGALAALHPDVKWADGEGGFVHGRREVRDHWQQQWKAATPTIEPLRFLRGASGDQVTVDIRLMVRDKEDNVMSDQTMQNIFVLERGLIKSMQIKES
jgi:ketosteroid isomerase-like protein